MDVDDKDIVTSSLENCFWLCPVDDLAVNVLDVDKHLNEHGYWLMDLGEDNA